MNLAATRWRARFCIPWGAVRCWRQGAGQSPLAVCWLWATGLHKAPGAIREVGGGGGLFATWSVVVALALRFWRALPTGDLHWGSGSTLGAEERWPIRRWCLPVRACRSAALHAGALGVGGSTPCWLWLERRAHPERWNDLRRAVYSRAETAGTSMPLDPSPPAG